MVHRIRTMLNAIKAVASGELGVIFGGSATIPYGLHAVSRGPN
jgi:hypothetical protein